MSYWGTVMDNTTNTQYGKRLMPVMVDDIAAKEPDRICYSFPRSTDLKDGFHNIKFQTFANAVSKTARFIEREIGRSSMFETVMYMGHPDVRHIIVLLALMKTGHKVLFSSHRNSVAGHVDLIKRTDCGILLYTVGFPVSDILDASRMESLCMPELDYLFDDSIHIGPFPYTKTFDQAKHHPCMVIHTSGTTGLPKPVVWTHWQFATSDAQRVPNLDGRPTIWGEVHDSSKRCYLGLPIFHGAGIVTALREVVLNGCTVVIGPPGIPNAEVFDKVVEYGRIDAANLLPVTLEDIASSSTSLGKLDRLKFITYVGASLSKQAGDTIAHHTHLYTIVASTETGTLIQHATDRSDWQYVCINPEYNGIEWYSRGDDLYELVFERNEDLSDMQGIFKTTPRAQEYSMSDLYSKHPTKPHHWKHEGRADDMIVFKSGWNFNPTKHEMLISSHVMVQHCILVGTGREMPVAIIELEPTFNAEQEDPPQAIITDLASKIDEANSFADRTGQLRKDAIIFAKKEKPFVVAGKGTVQRGATIALYEPEIDKIYMSLGKSGRVTV